MSSYKHGSNLTWIGYRDEKTGTLKRVTYRIVQVERPGLIPVASTQYVILTGPLVGNSTPTRSRIRFLFCELIT